MTHFLTPAQRRLASLPSQERETIELIVETFGAVLVEDDAAKASRLPGEARKVPDVQPHRARPLSSSVSTASQPPEGEQQMSLVTTA